MLTTQQIAISTEPNPTLKVSQYIPERKNAEIFEMEKVAESNECRGARPCAPTAIARYNAGQYQEAIALWTEALTQTSNQKDIAAIHGNLGIAYRQIGNLAQAIAQWEQAAKAYRSMADEESQSLLAQALTQQAQAYTALGQFRVAVPLLQSAADLAVKNRDGNTEAAARGALGNTYAASGDFEEAIASHQASLKLAATLNNPGFIATASNNLGNVLNRRYKRYLLQASSAKREGDDQEGRFLELAQQDAAAAGVAYERSVRESQVIGGIVQAKALLNLARFLQQLPSPPQKAIDTHRQEAMTILEKVPDSRAKAYSLINLALSTQHSALELRAATLTLTPLTKAIAVTRNIGDRRAESFALGVLGQFYEQAGELGKAMELTQQAEFAAQQVNAADSLYRWQAQAGRIYKAKGQTELAVSSYRQAIVSLQSIRSDIAAASKDLQFDLRDSVEPVYRELMTLLLNNNTQSKIQNPKSKIEEVLQISELLQLSELQNFFGDECVEVGRNSTDPTLSLATTNTATIQSIILSDRTYTILRLPDGSLNSYPVALSAKQLEKAIDRLRFTLEDISTDEYLVQAQKVYNLLIRPMEADLNKVKPKTLVFINDGVLRNVPMAALHDGKQFLVEKYAIAATLGLNLTPSRKQAPRDSKALIFGLSVAIPPFAPLPSVKAEVQGIQKIVGGKQFLDKDFTLANLQQQIHTVGYSIIHLATHGKFGADPSSTFLQMFDRRVSLNELETVLRQSKQPIDLLTLSACQTAAGDNRSTLGIAGVALRSGVQSTLASLWFVNDADTVPLIESFYTQMRQPGVTKAEALRQAQLKVIADANGHPAIWSPFVLVGNWQ